MAEIFATGRETTPGWKVAPRTATGHCANGLQGYGMDYVADGVHR